MVNKFDREITTSEIRYAKNLVASKIRRLVNLGCFVEQDDK